MNECCKGCRLWFMFKKECHYYWEDKKICPSRVDDKNNIIFDNHGRMVEVKE